MKGWKVATVRQTATFHLNIDFLKKTKRFPPYLYIGGDCIGLNNRKIYVKSGLAIIPAVKNTIARSVKS